MKKLISIVIAIILFTGCIPVMAQDNIEVYNNKVVFDTGQETALVHMPFFYKTDKNYLYVAIEDVAKGFGFSLGWDTERNAEICISNGNTYYLYPDKNEVEHNGQVIWFDAPSIIRDNIFYINDAIIEFMTGKQIKSAENIGEYGKVTVIGRSKKAFINGTETTYEAEPYIYMSKLFISIDSAFTSCGYVMGWDDDENAVICYLDGQYTYINTTDGKVRTASGERVYDTMPVYIKNVMYICADTFRDITGYDVELYGKARSFRSRDTLSDTSRYDNNRLAGNSIVRGGGVVVADGFGMELVSASQTDSVKYAGVINAVAETIPDVNVYNILVPTAAEFYAPAGLYPNQLSSIKTVYENLSDKVTPINVYDTLGEHTNEKIYFKTDHHWTQRGAYYAYKEFIEYKGKTIDDLSTFKNVPSYNFVGSFADFAKGTQAGNIMKNSPELLERFIPKFATVGTVYSDCGTQSKQYEVRAVNTDNNSYSCFIGGDGAVTVFYTDAPSDESIVIIKESFGNAFATWAMHNYKKVCIIDPRRFNGFGGNYQPFNLKSFCDSQQIDDVVFINYPVVVASSGIRSAILSMK